MTEPQCLGFPTAIRQYHPTLQSCEPKRNTVAFWKQAIDQSVAVSRDVLNVRGDSHLSPRKGFDWIPSEQQPCCQPARLTLPVWEVVQQLRQTNIAVENLKLWL